MGRSPEIAASAWSACAVFAAPWREPTAAAKPFSDEPYTLVLLSDGSPGARWSYLMRAPAATLEIRSPEQGDVFARAAASLGQIAPSLVDGPPFQGGLAGLFTYEAGLLREPSVGAASDPDWPLVSAGLYPAVLAFDHQQKRVLALGRGASRPEAEARAQEAVAWLQDPPVLPNAQDVLAAAFSPAGSAEAYRAAVADVVARIGAGELFQANIART